MMKKTSGPHPFLQKDSPRVESSVFRSIQCLPSEVSLIWEWWTYLKHSRTHGGIPELKLFKGHKTFRPKSTTTASMEDGTSVLKVARSIHFHCSSWCSERKQKSRCQRRGKSPLFRLIGLPPSQTSVFPRRYYWCLLHPIHCSVHLSPPF